MADIRLAGTQNSSAKRRLATETAGRYNCALPHTLMTTQSRYL